MSHSVLRFSLEYRAPYKPKAIPLSHKNVLHSNHLNTGQKSLIFKWLGYSITIIMLRIAILMYYHLKSGPDFKWFNHLKTGH